MLLYNIPSASASSLCPMVMMTLLQLLVLAMDMAQVITTIPTKLTKVKTSFDSQIINQPAVAATVPQSLLDDLFSSPSNGAAPLQPMTSVAVTTAPLPVPVVGRGGPLNYASQLGGAHQ